MTADAQSRAYGDANPALTYQVGGSGLVNGDSLSGALATSATIAEQCRHLRHHPGHTRGLRQLRAELNEQQPHRHPRAITVTANAQSRAYGDANPALTYQVGGSGLANGDSLSGALATSATAPAMSASTGSPRARWRPPATTR